MFELEGDLMPLRVEAGQPCRLAKSSNRRTADGDTGSLIASPRRTKDKQPMKECGDGNACPLQESAGRLRTGWASNKRAVRGRGQELRNDDTARASPLDPPRLASSSLARQGRISMQTVPMGWDGAAGLRRRALGSVGLP